MPAGNVAAIVVLSVLLVSDAAIINITRVIDGGDIFSSDQWRCDTAYCIEFDAFVNTKNPCRCQCYPDAPVLLQNIQRCRRSLTNASANYFLEQACQLVQFDNLPGVSAQPSIPTVLLPSSPGQILNSHHFLNWTGARVTSNPDLGAVVCRVNSVSALAENGWRVIAAANDSSAKPLFYLLTVNNRTQLQWLGSREQQDELSGKVILLGIKCSQLVTAGGTLCVALRIAGVDSNVGPAVQVINLQDSSNGSAAGESREKMNAGFIVGIVCALLLVLTLLGVALFWMVCWRQQKNKLVKKVQMHYYYQQKMAVQGIISNGMLRHAYPVTMAQESFVPTSLEAYPYSGFQNGHHWRSGMQHNIYEADETDCGRGSSSPRLQMGTVSRAAAIHHQLNCPDVAVTPPLLSTGRRRLYFSSEFFEPDMMADPPPIAEEFLSEVRKMINIAKNRIRSRRYIPSLLVIEENESTSNISSVESYDQALTGYENQVVALVEDQLLSISGGQKDDLLREDDVDDDEQTPSNSSQSSPSPPGSGGSSEESNKVSQDSGFSTADSDLKNATADDIETQGQASISLNCDSSTTEPTLITHDTWLQRQRVEVESGGRKLHSKVANWLKNLSTPSDSGDAAVAAAASPAESASAAESQSLYKSTATLQISPTRERATPAANDKPVDSHRVRPMAGNLLKRYGIQSMDDFPSLSRTQAVPALPATATGSDELATPAAAIEPIRHLAFNSLSRLNYRPIRGHSSGSAVPLSTCAVNISADDNHSLPFVHGHLNRAQLSPQLFRIESSRAPVVSNLSCQLTTAVGSYDNR